MERSSAFTLCLLVMIEASLAACHPPAKKNLPEAPNAVADGSAGPRGQIDRPVAVLERVCPPEVTCSLSDVNGDHKADLVRRDPSGLLGKPGSLEVALAHGWGFGPLRRTDADCPADRLCLVAPLTQQRGAGLLVVDRTQGKLEARRLSYDGTTQDTLSVRVLGEQGICMSKQDRCSAIQFDADSAAELAWLDAKGTLRVFDVEGGQPIVIETACDESRACQFGNFDDRPGLDLALWTPGKTGTWVHSHGDAKARPMPFDCSDGACVLADLDGDGRTDVLRPDKTQQHLELWPAAQGFQSSVPQPESARCGVEERCLWSDVNGDRFADLVRIDRHGTLFVHLNLDARGRLEAATLALSTFVTRQNIAHIADVDAFLAAPPRDPARPPTAMSEGSFSAERVALTRRVEEALDELWRAIPDESSIDSEGDVARVEELSLYIALGRTVLAAAGVGASDRAQGCANVVLHERSELNGVVRQAPSYLFRYAQALRTVDAQTQVAQMVDALTATTAGFRCLGHGEIAQFDTAFADAVLETADELHDRGHEMAAKWLVDDSLPILLLSFDATKYASLPGSYRLLAARFDADGAQPGEVPAAGHDFDAARASLGCDTFVCRTYGHARRSVPEARGLRLDRLGVWLPDPLRASRLRRVDVDAFDLLREMRDLRIFGEGDCSMLEIVTGGFSCRSSATCRAGPVGAPEDPTSMTSVPGELGDPLTHLLTERTGLATSNRCGTTDGSSSGGAVMAGCEGPALDSRRGRFSPDPELDTILRCAFENASAPVQTSFDISQGCLTGQPGGAGTTSPPAPADVEADAGVIKEKVADALREDSPLRQRTVAALREEYTELSESQIVALLGDAADSVAAAQNRDLPDDPVLPGQPARTVLGTTLRPISSRGDPDIFYDVEAHISAFGDDAAGEIGRTLGDESLHAFGILANRRHGVTTDAEREHRVSRRLGLSQQCADGPCDTSCSAGDEFFERFSECIDPPPTATLADVACQYAQDVCGDRRQGEMGGFDLGSGCAPSLPDRLTNRDCLVVQCGIDASPLAAACCSAGAPESAPPVLDISFGPGPYPPPPNFDVFAAPWPSLTISWEP